MTKFNKYEEVLFSIKDEVKEHVFQTGELIMTQEQHKQALLSTLLSIQKQCEEAVKELREE